MKLSAGFEGLTCTDCGSVVAHTVDQGCPDCEGPLEPTYDYDEIDPDDCFGPSTTGSGQWQFDALLPFQRDSAITAAEGSTPLVPADRLASELDVDEVYIKDEGRNPTGTVYDRGMSLAVTALSGHDDLSTLEPLALASTGNSGQSAAAYVGRLGVRSYAFVPSRSAFSNKAMINVHGGQMRVVGGRYSDAADAVDDQLATDYYSLQEFTTPYRHEGAKTVAFELYADLGELPDVLFVPTSTGELVAGIAKGFHELTEIGLTEETPTLVAVQPTSCCPITAAFDRGLETPEPWTHPDTIIGELEVPDPAGGGQAVAALRQHDGGVVTVDDSDSLDAATTVAQHEVIEMGAAGGAAAAGAWNWSEAGEFDGDETVVVLNTESGVKTPDILRSHLMGQGV
ncbi:threonine synthase [Halohasta litchfieldiae]|jgi:threonine synthase|uniref:L-threonine synthase n=1 Tax=Halohasta litchfieldiae TaxID=1073996 RepID=A0A1H6TGB8_9EURY|nr:pyridoxal-phosphate dependent enzyme [Halohasta litchfieldiae]ATW87743.1 threonine synthase [Halohasta litchfieldiae]SEI74822.1 L-threonine synthase [Halohasta litchfieldiae]